MKTLRVLLLFLIAVWSGSEPTLSANILVYGIVGSYSQRLTMWPMVEELAERGHSVTFLSPYENKNPSSNPNIYDYAPELWKAKMGSWESHYSFYDKRKIPGGLLQNFFGILDLGVLSCELLYKDDKFVGWMKSSKFDIVIVDSLMNECAFGMVHFWNSKLIVYGATTVESWFYDQLAFPDESSSVTDFMLAFPAGKNMNFFHRFCNALFPLLWKLIREFSYFPKLEDITKKGLSLREVPLFSEIERNTSLALVTSHYTIDYPRSFPPYAIPIGGIVVSRKKNSLSKDLEDFLGKSKNGFVYISFGTAVEFIKFEIQTQLEFVSAISSFPDIQFVWKSSFGINMTLPKNILVTKWVSQQALLAHPKIRAFITHSGMGSTAETIHNGVPVISFPVLGDQDMNSNCLISRGAGIQLEITQLKKSQLEHAIHEILDNPKYRQAMQRLTVFFKDRPMQPLETAIWWIEFVIRHDYTNQYLQPPTVGQPWWMKRQLDVWLTALIIATIVITTPLYLLFLILRKVCSVVRKTTGSNSKTSRQTKGKTK